MSPSPSANGWLSARAVPPAIGVAKMARNRATSVTIEGLLRSGSGSRFYGDGAPRWREGRSGKPSTTAEQAAHRRNLLVKALRRDRGAKAMALAGKLTTCSSRHRCVSGACPICGRALQRMCVDATRNLFDDHGGEMLAVNVVMRRGWIELGDLIDDDIFDENSAPAAPRTPGRERPGSRWLRRLVERARGGGIRPVLGAARFHSRAVPPDEATRSKIPGMVFGRRSNASPDFHPRV